MKNADKPAMPIEFNGFGQYQPEAHAGLTKREMFAMHAMQGLCSSANSDGEWSHDAKLAASVAVEYADALLAELERTK